MKSVFTKSIVRSLVSVVTLAIIAPLALADVAPEKGKIYMLTVWTGTSWNKTKQVNGDMSKDTDFRDGVNASKFLFEGQLKKLKLDPTDKDLIAEYVVLEKQDTSPQKIIDTIDELAQKAGEDDALFVYIMSHGAMVDPEINYQEERSPELQIGFDREHFVMPLIDTPSPNFNEDSILRSNLLYYMRSKKHRLDVLITDSCSSSVAGTWERPYNTNVQLVVTDRAPTTPHESDNPRALRYLLTHANGTISWNSTCPCFCYYIKAVNEQFTKDENKTFIVPKLSHTVKKEPGPTQTSKTFEVSYISPQKGSVFTSAFIQAASRPIENPENGYTFDDFFLDLGADYDAMYGDFLRRYSMTDYPLFEKAIKRQALTTLTSFNIENDHSSDEASNLEIMLKTNNRVRDYYQHPEENTGSGKTELPTISLSFVQ